MEEVDHKSDVRRTVEQGTVGDDGGDPTSSGRRSSIGIGNQAYFIGTLGERSEQTGGICKDGFPRTPNARFAHQSYIHIFVWDPWKV